MKPTKGVEPLTARLRIECSTTELRRRVFRPNPSRSDCTQTQCNAMDSFVPALLPALDPSTEDQLVGLNRRPRESSSSRAPRYARPERNGALSVGASSPRTEPDKDAPNATESLRRFGGAA